MISRSGGFGAHCQEIRRLDHGGLSAQEEATAAAQGRAGGACAQTRRGSRKATDRAVGSGCCPDLRRPARWLLIAQDASLEAEQFGLVAQLASGVHRNIELVGKYLGEFASHTTLTTISILVTPEYLDLRATLLRALQPYGDARRAVAAAFLQVEEKAAQRSAATAQHPPEPILDGGAHADT